MLVGFVAVVAWVFFERGLGASAYDAFERPHLLLLVFVVSVLSGGFHEFGHAAAARYSGAEPGRDGRRAVPRLAGVLHRRDRQLPAGPGAAGSAPTWAACTSTPSSSS